MPVITAVDVVGIQRFIFASNRLKDAVSGSWFVHWSTTKEGALKELVEGQRVLMAAGGNAILGFDTLDEARSFACRYTRRLHHEAPGLEVALVHREYQKDELAHALLNIQVDLARRKMEPKVSSPLPGLSVTASCRETGLPAVGFDAREPTLPLGRGILKRRQVVNDATHRWKAYLEDSRFHFPMELDQLGRAVGDSSFIGIVHVDGNGVGAKIKGWLETKRNDDVPDDQVLAEYRAWSGAMDRLADRVFRTIVRKVIGAVARGEDGGYEIKGQSATPGFSLKMKGDGCYLPLRPILIAGDDITFICDGRIALDLAETALSEFKRSDIPHLGKITACAGIAIVPVHHPFYRAYELAERLCANAKTKLLEEGEDSAECAMDWHIGVVPLGKRVRDFRRKTYGTEKLTLTCRPYLLGDGESPETWMWLSRRVLNDPETGLQGQVWAEHRNKAKKLGELVRDGPVGIKNAMKRWRVAASKLTLPEGIEEDGFFSRVRTPLLDAAELLDLYLALDGNGHGENAQGEKEVFP